MLFLIPVHKSPKKAQGIADVQPQMLGVYLVVMDFVNPYCHVYSGDVLPPTSCTLFTSHKGLS